MTKRRSSSSSSGRRSPNTGKRMRAHGSREAAGHDTDGEEESGRRADEVCRVRVWRRAVRGKVLQRGIAGASSEEPESDVKAEEEQGGGDHEACLLGDEPDAEEDEPRMCEVCGADGEGGRHAATHFCENCRQHMCDVVTKAHRRIKATSGHTVKEIEGSRPAPFLPPLCTTHRRPFTDFYCKEDKCFVCAECMARDHRGHTFVEEGEELVETVKGWLEDEIERAQTRAGELEEAGDGLVEDRERLLDCGRLVINDINAVFHELEKTREELVNSVVSLRSGASQQLYDVCSTSRSLRKEIASQQAEQARRQLRQLVEDSKAVRTHRGDLALSFDHSDAKLKAWCDSLRVRVTGASWEARPGALSQPLPSLNSARDYLTAVVVTPSNHVFVVGGEGSDKELLNSVERLAVDGSGRWEAKAGLAVPTARFGCGACAVGATVIVVGGCNDEGDELDVVEAVDTASGIHTTLPPLPRRLQGCGVVSAQSRVIVTGGRDGLSSSNAVWALDVGNDADFQQHLQWTPLSSMTRARCYHGAAAGDGCVFVCGGFDGNTLDSCEMLRVAVGAGARGGRWKALPPMPKKLRLGGCCFGGGNVFVVGGRPGAKRSVFALSVGEGKWTHVAELATGRHGCAAVCVGRRVLVLGGHNDNCGGHLSSCEAFEF